jgi:hypothetical protein
MAIEVAIQQRSFASSSAFIRYAAPCPHPRLWPPTSASLRMQSISVDEAEHFTAQSTCQRRYASMAFRIGSVNNLRI